jgi:hypothetical protein
MLALRGKDGPHGLDDVVLVRAGATSVVGVDQSAVAAGAAQRRADELGVACRYVVDVVEWQWNLGFALLARRR